MKYLLFILFLSFLSCNPFGFDIWHDINGDGTIDTTDTVQVAEEFIFDTCSGYFNVSGPTFVCWFTNLDVMPSQYQFYYKNQLIDLQSFLSQYGESHLYFSGINIGGTLTGNVTSQQFQGQIYCLDGEGTRFMLTFGYKALIPRGSETFDQYFAELTSKPNVEFLDFYNTGWTCDQYNQIADFLLADCKECDFIIYLNGTFNCIPQDKLDEMTLRGATIVP